jgi:peptide/nickel transport system substrate-binding protein
VDQRVVEENGGIEPDTPNEFLAQNESGTGKYNLVSWERGERMSLEVNQEYWGEPAQENLIWFNVQDPNVSTLGLRAGDYDIIEGVPAIIPDVESS